MRTTPYTLKVRDFLLDEEEIPMAPLDLLTEKVLSDEMMEPLLAV